MNNLCLYLIQKQSIEDKLKTKIANAHGVEEDEINITRYTKGSVNVHYPTPETSGELDYANLDYQLKNKFNQFEKMEVHTAFFSPEFDINMFDERGHHDFTNEGDTYNIGGMKYFQPRGWIRMGLRVDGYGDKSWLEPFDENNSSLWVRGYHGPGSAGGNSLSLASKIYKSGGLRVGSNNLYGPGVYWSDDPNFADGAYDGQSTSFGKQYDVKLMVAVNPHGYSDNGGNNFHCADPANIRMYGILIREQ